MKANDEVPASQGKIPMAFTARSSHPGRTFLPRKGKDGQNRATSWGIR